MTDQKVQHLRRVIPIAAQAVKVKTAEQQHLENKIRNWTYDAGIEHIMSLGHTEAEANDILWDTDWSQDD